MTQPLHLKCDLLVSKFAFKWVSLYRYAAVLEEFGGKLDDRAVRTLVQVESN